MAEPNPYRPPGSSPMPTKAPGRFRPVRLAARAVTVILGFALLAGPYPPAPNSASHHGQIAARALGGILILAGIVPFGWPRSRATAREDAPEDL